MTEKQATEIARNILESNFRVYGLGNFDLYFEDIVNLLQASSSSLQESKDLYEKLEGVVYG